MNEPKHQIGYIAEQIGVHVRTLRLWEKEGLVCPKRKNNRRLYSDCNLEEAKYIRFLTADCGLNIAGVNVAQTLTRLLSACSPKNCKDLKTLQDILKINRHNIAKASKVTVKQMEANHRGHRARGRKKTLAK